MERKLLIPIWSFLIAIAFLFPSVSFAQEWANFSSNIRINSDASLTVKEAVAYFTDTARHGIYRYLPNSPEEKIKIIAVTDPRGRPYHYQIRSDKQKLVIRIGDPHQTFTGNRTYLIVYKISHPVHKTKNNLKLLWDIAGEGWQFPLYNVHATLHSPAPISQYACYSGPVGGNDRLCRMIKKNEHTLLVTYPKPIGWGDNLTIMAIFPPHQGITPPPTAILWLQKFRLFFPLLLGTFLFFLFWFLRGRDYLPDNSGKFKGIFQHLTVDITASSPPPTLTPGQAGLLIDEKVDARDLVAEIIELARRKYLKIEKKTKKRFLGHATDYLFFKLRPEDRQLTSYQKTLLKGIFKKKTKVKLSELKGHFRPTFEKARDQLYQSTLRQYFTRNPSNDRLWGYAAAFLLALFQSFIFKNIYYLDLFSLSSLHSLSFYLLLAFVGATLINFWFAYHFPQKTSLGTKSYLFLKGLQENLRRGAWRDTIKEKHLFLEEIIPYAISLGSINQLAKDMKKLDLQPPEYVGSFAIGSNIGALDAGLISFTKSAAHSFAYNPKSGSGFAGGFSGGGGGGGGGGSW